MNSDWVNVKLTEFGAQQGDVYVSDGARRHFRCAPGQVLRVTRAVDWALILDRAHVDGKALFEITTDEATEE